MMIRRSLHNVFFFVLFLAMGSTELWAQADSLETIWLDSAASTIDTGHAAEGRVYTVVEIQPKYPGGQLALFRFLSSNISYPLEAQEKGVQGVVYVQFIVNEDGTVSDVEVIRGVHALLDAEALRVVRMMPDWEPGYQSGKPVKVSYKLPLRFSLKSAESKREKRKRQRRQD